MIKKTNRSDLLSEAEQRRYEDIVRIQTLLADSYAPVQIKELLHTTYYRIRRYATGDPIMLCRFSRSGESQVSKYKDAIVGLLTQNVSKKHAREQLTALGYRGKRTAFEAYCRRLVCELEIPYMPRRNTAGAPIDTNQSKPMLHYVSKSDLERYLWTGKELEPADIEFIFSKYPHVLEIQQCIQDFRRIYDEKDTTLLHQFIERYVKSRIKPIKSFASGLRGDLDAITNSVICDLSNGFVEGINNKIKVIKRIMYGRAKIDLLRIKVLYAR